MEQLCSLVHERIHWKGNLNIESEKCPYSNLVTGVLGDLKGGHGEWEVL